MYLYSVVAVQRTLALNELWNERSICLFPPTAGIIASIIAIRRQRQNTHAPCPKFTIRSRKKQGLSDCGPLLLLFTETEEWRKLRSSDWLSTGVGICRIDSKISHDWRENQSCAVLAPRSGVSVLMKRTGKCNNSTFRVSPPFCFR